LAIWYVVTPRYISTSPKRKLRNNIDVSYYFVGNNEIYELSIERCRKGYQYRYRRYFGSEISISYRYWPWRYRPTSSHVTSTKADITPSGRFVCHSACAQPRKKLCMNLHESFAVPKFGLGPVSRWVHFGGYPDWPSLSFRGHSCPARSFWHKIDCSAETVRDTAKVTIEH